MSGQRARGGRPASPRGHAASLPCAGHRFLLPSGQPCGRISGPRPVVQLHPSSKLYPELSPSAPGLDLTHKWNSSRPRPGPPATPTLTLTPPHPQPPAGRAPHRPCERTRGLRGDAPPRTGPHGRGGRHPAQNSTREPGCRGGAGKFGKSKTWRPYMQAFRSAAPPPPPQRNGFKSLRAAEVAAALAAQGRGLPRSHSPPPSHPCGRGLRATPLSWRRSRQFGGGTSVLVFSPSGSR